MENKSNCKKNWDPSNFISLSIENIRKQVGQDKVLCALSGGVDSTVLAILLHKAIGSQLVCFHIDTGLMRMDESVNIVKLFKESFGIEVNLVQGQKEFFEGLKGIKDPEEKRKIIGKTYIDLFDKEANRLKDCKWLAQGTIYPDVVESDSNHKVKSHHNVGGLPQKMNLKLIEPLRELYKYEVREIGKELNIPAGFIDRHPFPGPGLAVRVLGEVTPEKVAILQKADAIFLDELHKNNLYHSVWQAFVIILPVQSVGVRDNKRTYDYTCVIRAINSKDGMTAEYAKLPFDILDKTSTRICNEVEGISRVVYDITNKPPGTIEWE